MSAAWCKANGVTRTPDFTKKEEGHSTRNAMGTGPFVLEKFEPGIRVTLAKNPAWWDRFEGNVTRIVYTPIGNDGTRTAALLSGDIDFTHDTPPQDLTRLAAESSVKLVQGPENRVLFFVMDQFRDELLHSSVKGKNPFKDVRVREAFAHGLNVLDCARARRRGPALQVAPGAQRLASASLLAATS